MNQGVQQPYVIIATGISNQPDIIKLRLDREKVIVFIKA
jgi:hypothetical protein